MTAVRIEVTTLDPFVAMRALGQLRAAGFTLELEEGRLMVEPLSRLTEPQRAYLRAHKPELVALLQDADILLRALAQAGPAGLAWLEGTPADWTPVRLLAAGEVLYASGQMVNRQGRRYRAEPPEPPEPPKPTPEPTAVPVTCSTCRHGDPASGDPWSWHLCRAGAERSTGWGREERTCGQWETAP